MFGKKIEPVDRIAIVTVHGTNDGAESPSGQKWWQVGSAFAEGLKARLAGVGVNAEIVPHRWTGKNSASDRESGADGLAALIKRYAKTHRGVHVIGHSHGGNVANDAADFLRWGRWRDKRLSSVTTVGTPFFNSRTSLAKKGAGIAFMGLTWASVGLFPMVLIGWLGFIIYQISDASLRVRDQVARGVLVLSDAFTFEQALANEHRIYIIHVGLWVLYLVTVGLALRFMWRISTHGVRRVMRPKKIKESPAQIFSLWHPNDEAIAFLRKVDKARIEPFPKGSMFRGSRTSAVGFSVMIFLIVFMAGVLGAGVFFAMATGLVEVGASPIVADLMGVSVDEISAGATAGFITAMTLIALFLAPVIFSLLFMAYRYIVGSLLEVGARGPLNTRVSNTLRGMAFGKDGDQVLCDISPTSHTINCKELVISGALADHMRTGAEIAMDKLLKEYRWALFDVDNDSEASIKRFAEDALTWDSLIHTTYFDQPEVLEAIADHIAAEAKRLGEVAAAVQ